MAFLELTQRSAALALRYVCWILKRRMLASSMTLSLTSESELWPIRVFGKHTVEVGPSLLDNHHLVPILGK
jgi:hypothetical protein